MKITRKRHLRFISDACFKCNIPFEGRDEYSRRSEPPAVNAMDPTETSDTATVNLEATVGSCELKMSVSVPAGPTKLDDLCRCCKSFRTTSWPRRNARASNRANASRARKVAVACCRQLVPFRRLRPGRWLASWKRCPSRGDTKSSSRFAAARQRLEEAGLWQRLTRRQEWPEERRVAMGWNISARNPCPFLEDESCSIHRDRPLTCREYLVTSPAENCANPTPERRSIGFRCRRRCGVGARRESNWRPAQRYINWIPLIQALDWAAENPSEPTAKTLGPSCSANSSKGFPAPAMSRCSRTPRKACSVSRPGPEEVGRHCVNDVHGR